MIPLDELELRGVRWMRDVRRNSRMALFDLVTRPHRKGRGPAAPRAASLLWFMGFE